MGSEIVRIYIGPDKTDFTIHKALLLASGSIFSDMFTPERQPGERVMLGMEEPETFKLFIEYLYTKTIPRAPYILDHCRLYAFTDKFRLDVLVCNRAMDAVQDAFLAIDTLPDADIVDAVYELTPVGSKLRGFCIAGLVFALQTGRYGEDGHSWEELVGLLVGNMEVLMDFVKAVAAGDGVVRDPRIRDCQGDGDCVECGGDPERLAGKHGVWPCQYHIHLAPKIKKEDESEEGEEAGALCHLWNL